MEDLQRDCYSGKIPGVKSIQYAHVEEVDSVIITGKDTASVTLKSSGRWGAIKGKLMTASSVYDRSWTNEIRATLPGWTIQDAVTMGRLTAGRYLVAFTDRAGDTWLAGYGTPMHLAVSKTAPDTPTEYQGIELVFSCESEFGFLKMV
jgi:hypothetical protein